MKRYTDSSYSEEADDDDDDDEVEVGDTVYYGLAIDGVDIDGVSFYIDSCTFGNDERQLPIISQFVSYTPRAY